MLIRCYFFFVDEIVSFIAACTAKGHKGKRMAILWKGAIGGVSPFIAAGGWKTATQKCLGRCIARNGHSLQVTKAKKNIVKRKWVCRCFTGSNKATRDQPNRKSIVVDTIDCTP